MTSNTNPHNYTQQYKEEEIYISKTIIKYDEYGNVLSRNVYYDKEIKYADRTNNLHTIQPMTNTYEPYNQSYNHSYNHSYNQSQGVSSTHTSPSSSVPTSPTSLDSVSINMSNISMYNN